MNNNKVCPAPPMGWNSYDYYDTSVTEEEVRANARILADKLKPFGWEYIVVDIEWYAHNAGSQRDRYQYIPFGSVEMDEYSRLLPDPARFPSAAGGKGFKPLADEIHDLGLKFGIHMMRGIPRAAAHEHRRILGSALTADQVADPASVCRWNPDMYGVRDCPEGQAYYNSVAALYAAWGVDFIKCDDICNTDNLVPHSDRAYARSFEIEMLARAIRKTGRPMVLSLSPGPAIVEKAWHYKKHANMWRITDDFWDEWPLLKEMFRRCEQWQDHVGPGCFPDCDMLPLGELGGRFPGGPWQTRFTRVEQRTMLTLWCLFGSPLMLGCQLTSLDDWTLGLLTNRDVLAMLTPDCRPNQVERDELHALWTAENGKTGERYAALFNLSEEERTLTINLPEDWGPLQAGRELWTGACAGLSGGVLTAKVPPHGGSVFRVE